MEVEDIKYEYIDYNKFDESVQLELVSLNPKVIGKIDNPSERVQLTALAAARLCKFRVDQEIKNPCELAQIQMLCTWPPNITHFKNPSPALVEMHKKLEEAMFIQMRYQHYAHLRAEGLEVATETHEIPVQTKGDS